MLRLDPLTARQFRRFRAIRRGWYSLLVLLLLAAATLAAELLVSHRALFVEYEGRWHFPTYAGVLPGTTFGLGYPQETNYRELAERLAAEPGKGRILLPPVPFGPFENCYPGEFFRPRPPDWSRGHLLGTDQLNRDILARLLYGLRNALIFASLFVLLVFAIGTTLGCAMGFVGGRFDLVAQRLIEIWQGIPFLYAVIIVSAVVRPGLGSLLLLVVCFSWMGMTYYMRSGTYREKARDYVAAARVVGAGPLRILFRHLLPNLLSTLVTFAPFQVAAAITSLTALDFLGFGLQPPEPSWGELLRQGTSNLNAPWIVASAFGALVLVLTLVNFVGEAVREAFDPRKFVLYR